MGKSGDEVGGRTGERWRRVGARWEIEDGFLQSRDPRLPTPEPIPGPESKIPGSGKASVSHTFSTDFMAGESVREIVRSSVAEQWYW